MTSLTDYTLSKTDIIAEQEAEKERLEAERKEQEEREAAEKASEETQAMEEQSEQIIDESEMEDPIPGETAKSAGNSHMYIVLSCICVAVIALSLIVIRKRKNSAKPVDTQISREDREKDNKPEKSEDEADN